MAATNKTTLITGASSGIGYELAKLFAHDHYNLVLVARSGAKLAQLSDQLQRQFGITARAVTADLAAPSAPEQLFAQLDKDGIAIDVLVNNAAYGKFGPFSEMALEEVTGQIELNIVGLTTLTRLFRGPARARGSACRPRARGRRPSAGSTRPRSGHHHEPGRADVEPVHDPLPLGRSARRERCPAAASPPVTVGPSQPGLGWAATPTGLSTTIRSASS